MNINWYPGHMVKAKRKIQETLNLIDTVIELVDARSPLSTKNPDVDGLIGNKPKIIALNKADLADDRCTKEWVEYYKSIGIKSVIINSLTGQGMKELLSTVYEINKEKTDKNISNGVIGKAIRLAILGIPNVGKSSFINKFVNKSIAKIGNRPGVTTSNQWIRINEDVLLLDTPGVLWPKFEEEIGLKLCYIGAIKDEIIDIETVAYKFLELISKNYEKNLYERYKIDEDFKYNQTIELMDKIAQKRGCILSGNRVDYNKVSNIILDEFQTGKLGRITLERVSDVNA